MCASFSARTRRTRRIRRASSASPAERTVSREQVPSTAYLWSSNFHIKHSRLISHSLWSLRPDTARRKRPPDLDSALDITAGALLMIMN